MNAGNLSTAMFVGREQEIQWLMKTLKDGLHPVLVGKYGIGRTSLISHLADVSDRDWTFIFLDASQSPAALCRILYSQLPSPSQLSGDPFGFRGLRYLVLNTPLGKRKTVLVWDNVARLSYAKLDLLKRLVTCDRFLIVAIVEEFLPADEFKRLRMIFAPAPVLSLSYLPPSDSLEFFRRSATQLGLELPEERLKQLVTLAHGFPLELTRQLAKLSTLMSKRREADS